MPLRLLEGGINDRVRDCVLCHFLLSLIGPAISAREKTMLFIEQFNILLLMHHENVAG